MAIDPVGSALGASTSAASTKKDHARAGRLPAADGHAAASNQDPFKPMDPSQFLGQLAQFGTVSGIQDMQKSIGTLSDSLRSSQVLGGTSLVGHDVLAVADTATLGASGEISGAVDQPGRNQRRSDGGYRRQRPAGEAHPAVQRSRARVGFTWDGNTDLGVRAPAGNYTMTAIAKVGGSAEQIRDAADQPGRQRDDRSQQLQPDPQHRSWTHRRWPRAPRDVKEQTHAISPRTQRPQRGAAADLTRHRQQHRQHRNHRLQGLARGVRGTVRRLAAGRVFAAPSATACACGRGRSSSARATSTPPTTTWIWRSAAPGFFTLSDGGALAYTRAGAFKTDSSGYVVNAAEPAPAGLSADRRPVASIPARCRTCGW